MVWLLCSAFANTPTIFKLNPFFVGSGQMEVHRPHRASTSSQNTIRTYQMVAISPALINMQPCVTCCGQVKVRNAKIFMKPKLESANPAYERLLSGSVSFCCRPHLLKAPRVF